jgi:hypothetical protein
MACPHTNSHKLLLIVYEWFVMQCTVVETQGFLANYFDRGYLGMKNSRGSLRMGFMKLAFLLPIVLF